MVVLDDEHLELAVKSAVTQEQSKKLLWHLMAISGCFTQGIAKDERTECYNRGRGDIGLYIRDLLIQYAPNVYKDFIEEGVKENER